MAKLTTDQLLDAFKELTLIELSNSETAVLGQQNGGRALEQFRELGNRGFLVRHGAP